MAMATTAPRSGNCNSMNISNNQNVAFLTTSNNHHSLGSVTNGGANCNSKPDDHYLFEYIYDLYVNQLYSDVIQTVRFFDNNLQRLRETFGLSHGLNVLFFYGVSLYHTHEYKLALQIFQQAGTYYSDHFAMLACKNTENVNNSARENTHNSISSMNSVSQNSVKNNSASGTGSNTLNGSANTNNASVKRKTIGENVSPAYGTSLYNESPMLQSHQSQFSLVEMKYHMHLCYKKLGETQCAITTLQSIPRESQTLKTLLALGDLCLETNNYHEALICYKHAVNKNPLAFNTLKKYFNHAHEKRAEEFVVLLGRKIESKVGPSIAELFKEYIRAQKLARHPKNFKQVSQLYFDLGKGSKIATSTPNQSPVANSNTSANSSFFSSPATTPTSGTYARKSTSASAKVSASNTVLASQSQSLNQQANQQTSTNIVQSLQLKPMHYDNMYLMLDAARNLYYDGYISNANYFFTKIFAANRSLIEGTDCWASCLYRDAKYKQLSQLTCDMISMCSATGMGRNRRYNQTSSNTNGNSNFGGNSFSSNSTSGNNNNNNNSRNDSSSSRNNDSNDISLNSSLTGPTGEILNLSKSNSIMIHRPEPWIVIGFYNLSKRDPKAIMFANKALTIDSSSEEAMILKTLIYTRGLIKDNGNFIEEMRQFIYKIKNQKNYVRFEFLKYLAESVLEKEGRDAAEVYVRQAIDKFGMSTRICTFYCSLIYSDKRSSIAEREKALKMLEDSVKATPFYMSAAVNLVKFYIKEDEDSKAIPLLEKLLEKFNYEFIHLMLIDCYKRVGLTEKAEIHRINHLRPTRGSEFTDYHRFNRQKTKEESINETLSELDLTNVSSISTYDDIHDNSFDRL